MYLDSPQNPRIRTWSQLKSRKGRFTQGAFLIEGNRLVEEALSSSLEVTSILWNVASQEPPADVREAVRTRRITFVEVSPQAFQVVSDTVTSQGLIAIAKIPDVLPQGQSVPSHALLLDGLQDPGNVGTLLRSADAFAIEQVCCAKGTVDPFSPKVVRASMGGLFRTGIVMDDGADYLNAWRAAWPNGQVVMTSARGGEDCYRVDLAKPSLFLIGNEAFGVKEETSALATVKVRIPITSTMESLNAAVAGAILMYESYRQRNLAQGQG